ncbi:hypothetical protein HY628_01530 [Candidatus Uhrbacteria bacterium]|nr:hypothetical protein [Candidatus Uhrbacteria bacterium]
MVTLEEETMGFSLVSPAEIKVYRRSSELDDLACLKGPVIAVLPLLGVTGVASEDFEYAESVLEQVFGLKVIRLPQAFLPGSFTRFWQWDADEILQYLFDRLITLPVSVTRIIGLINEDLFAIGRTFVYGYAHLRDGVAVVSLARLREEWYERAPRPSLYRSRLFRGLVHEVGHTFLLPHCDHDCLMSTVWQIESLDALPHTFCSCCEEKVRSGLSVALMSAEWYFQRAGALIRRSRPPAQAIQYFEQAIALAPGRANYHNDLGVALMLADDWQGAEKAFERAIECGADFPHPYYNLGVLQNKKGWNAVAERWFEKGLWHDPDRLEGYRYVGKIFEELFGDNHRALKYYQLYLHNGGGYDWEIKERVRLLTDSPSRWNLLSEKSQSNIAAFAAGSSGKPR